MDDIDLKRLEDILLEQAAAEGLYDDEKESVEMNWKERLKLFAPHIGLIVTSIIYATGFAVVFHHIERPHELKTKNNSLSQILALRERLVDNLWSTIDAQKQSRSTWVGQSMQELRNLTDLLFQAYNYHFVTMNDIRIQDDKNNTASVPSTLWSMPTAIFFSTTTMTTIGYGNLVPATFEGRILCVFFALLGTPLAIITIGDIGKFFSEYTIHFYQAFLTTKKWVVRRSRRSIRQLRHRQNGQPLSPDSKTSSSNEKEKDYDPFQELADELITDKTQVPVMLVFAILILYTALGAILFAFLEQWTYMDSFYFCFITLTTVGFGDLVPQKTQYFLLELIYIGIGLAVTTMCIDLVGIQYIQKIHYFGRKFKGTEWLAKLKRRRMLERRLALTIQQMAATDRWLTNMPSRKESGLSRAVSATPATPSVPSWPMLYECDNVDLEKHQVDVSPSIATTMSYRERCRLFSLLMNTSRHSDSVSGPGNSSLSGRERMYYLRSLLPPTEWTPVPPTPSPDEIKGLALMEDWQATLEMIEESLKKRSPINLGEIPKVVSSPPDETYTHNLLSPMDSGVCSPCGDDDLLEFPTNCNHHSISAIQDTPVFFKDIPVFTTKDSAVCSKTALVSALNCPTSALATQQLPSIVTDNYCFVLDGDNVADDMLLKDKDLWRPTSRPIRYYYSEDLQTFHRVEIIYGKDGRIMAAHLIRSKDLSLSPRKVNVPLEKVFRVARFYAYWKSCTDFHRIVSIVSPLTEGVVGFKQRTFVQYLWGNKQEEAKLRVALEYQPKSGKTSSRLSVPSSGTGSSSSTPRTSISNFNSTSQRTSPYASRRRKTLANL